jgi:DNA-binding CsgD family transcriptional regulator
MSERLLAEVDRLCAQAPVVLVLDDLQWADGASLSVWRRLSRSVGQLPLLLVVAGRLVPQRPEVAQLRRALLDAGTRLVSLGPLPDGEVLRLVGGLVGARVGPGLRQAASGAGGNPLFVREAVAALRRVDRVRVVDGVAEVMGEGAVAPTSLAEAIGGRLRILSPGAVPVVRSAAWLGTEFAVVDLATVLGVPATQLLAGVDEAVVAGVLVDSGNRLAFAHPLIRQALYESVPEIERAELHRLAARALAGVGAPVDRVAQQLLAVPDPFDDWVTDWLVREVSTLTARAPQVATDLLARAVAGLPTGDPRREPLATSLVAVYRLLGRYDEVQRVARPLWRHIIDPARAGQVAHALAYALAATGHPEEAHAVTSETVAQWTGMGSGSDVDMWISRIRALHAMVLTDLSRFDEASIAAEQAVASGERVGDRYAVAFGLHVLSSIADLSDHARALSLLDRALSVAVDDPDSQALVLLLKDNRIAHLMMLGRPPAEGEHAVRELLALVEQTGTPRANASRSRAAEFLFNVGRWDDAVAELEVAIEVVDEVPIGGDVRLITHGLRALIAGHRDDATTAQKQLDAVGRVALTSPPLRGAAVYAFLAQALADERSGHAERARDVLARVLEPDFATDMSDRPDCLPTLVRLALAAGDTDLAETAMQACINDTDEDPVWRKSTATIWCRGLVRREPALLRAAAGRYRAAGVVPDVAATLEDLAVLCAERGELEAARAAYAEAVDDYSGMGAVWDIRRAQARLRSYGIGGDPHRARARPGTGWYALTPTEVRVARLVADGLSNPDIATQLYLSRRTVQTHVSHILAKLDVQSRTEVARDASPGPLTPGAGRDPRG